MSASDDDEIYVTWQKPNLQPEPEPSNFTQKQIKERYTEVKEELDRDGIKEQLEIAFESLLANSKVDNINKCLCTSLGSFTTKQYEKYDKQPNRPMYQLAAFEIMKKSLEKHLKKEKIDIVKVQDPVMNSLDIAFVHSLGYEVIVHPQALGEMARDVFVFTPGALFLHVRELFHVYDLLPAVYVGVDLVGWIESKKPSECYTAETNESLKKFWPDNKKEHDKWIVPYIGLTTSQKLLIMNDKYPLPTVVAYVAKTKW